MTGPINPHELRRHLAGRPGSADGWFVFGLGVDGARSFMRTLSCRPDHIDAAANLGAALIAAGRGDLARVPLRRAIALVPTYAPALGNLALSALSAGVFDEAARLLRRILDDLPLEASTWINLGKVAERQGQLSAAVRAWRRAVAADPGSPLAQYNLGVIALDARSREAAPRLRRATILSPGNTEAWNNLGDALMRRDDLGPAMTAFRTSLVLQPGHAGVLSNLGIGFSELADRSRAESSLSRAIVCDPNYGEAHFNRALLLLGSGREAEGWIEYEWRLRVPRVGRPPSAAGRWRGEDLHQGTLLIHAEQGLGDVIQFARYVPAAARRAMRTILSVPKPLIRLLRSNLPGVDVVDAAAELPRHDAAIPIMSLAAALGRDEGPARSKVPYLARPEPADLRSDGRFVVGLVWAGNPDQARDHLRSTTLDTLEPLFSVPGVRWVSLQVGPRADDISTLGLSDRIESLGDRLVDLADTARFVVATDLMVSVCTAPAHLAGALGHPAWTLLAMVSDWRWGLRDEAVDWYPSMRLWRQPRRGDWRGLAARAAEVLRDLAQTVAAARSRSSSS